MRRDNRWLILLIGNVLFLWIVGQVNHHLTMIPTGFGSGPVYCFLGGLPIAFAALRLSLGYGLAVAIPTGLAMEAGLPVPPGTLMLPSAAVICIAVGIRGTFNRFDPASGIIMTLTVNLILMLALTAATGVLALQGKRLAVDLVFSQLVIAGLTGWFFAAELALLRLFGIDLNTELREAP